MSATVDTGEVVDAATLEKVIAKATPEQRQYVLDRLLPLVLEETGYLPLPLANAAGELIGYLMPRYLSTAKEPPPLTPEQRAELEYRLATPHNVISHEEMMARLGLADAARPSKR